MGARGPRPKSSPELRLAGTFRADRHADRDRIPVAAGRPVKPKYLKGEAAKCWANIVPELFAMNLIGAIDVGVIVCACESWAFYRQAADIAKDNPTDKLARCAVSTYHAMYMTALGKLGLSPADRAKLRAPVTPVEAGPTQSIADFARKRS